MAQCQNAPMTTAYAPLSQPLAQVPYQRIATEEAWTTPEIMGLYEKLLADGSTNDPGFHSLWGFFAKSTTERAQTLKARVLDIDARRIQDMDDHGIAMQLLMLTAPGVQLFDAATGTALAASTNDQLAETIRRHPTRFDGLAAVAPQDPQAAAKEIERAVNQLNLRGVVINSHTQGEYLDDPKYWDIFAAAEALNVPVYIHPNTPSPQMVEPYLSRGLAEAICGFAHETSLHVLRLIVAGVFDRFPKLQMVLGHLGEGLPYWLYRIDFMHSGIVRANRSPGAKPLQRTPSEVLLQNFHYTTSGMCWEPAVMYVHQVMGADRLLYAMDYPYQTVKEEVAAMDALPMSAEHKKMFFQTNAEKLFNLRKKG
jgi:5-carboxyvanillate decarboxylase